MQRRRKDPRHRSNAPDSGELVRPTLVGGDGFLPYHPGVQTNSAAKVSTVRTVVAQLGKESPSKKVDDSHKRRATESQKQAGRKVKESNCKVFRTFWQKWMMDGPDDEGSP